MRCYQLAQSETCLTLISGGRTAAGQAGRVSLRGSKCQRALPAGLTRAKRSGSRTAAAAASGTGTAGLSGLSSRCGGGSAFNAALALGLRSAMRLWRGHCVRSESALAALLRRLPLVHVCCLSRDKQDSLRYAPFLFRRVEIAIRAFLGRCGVRGLVCGAMHFLSLRLPSVYARRCGSVVAFCPPFTPAVCLATNRTACDSLRSYSAGSRSPFARSRGVGAVICLGWFTLGLCVSLGRSRRGYRRTENGERRTGLAARPLCAFAQSYRP